MSKQTQIADFVDRLIAEGDAVVATKFTGRYRVQYVKLEPFTKWRGRCKHLLLMLGPLAPPWQATFTESDPTMACAKATQGTLKGIRECLAEGLLIRFEDLVLADIFSDLLDQADYLLSKNYFRAAGVLGRAVLEERLRRLCVVNGCQPKQADADNRQL